jgi:hypothetical protein
MIGYNMQNNEGLGGWIYPKFDLNGRPWGAESSATLQNLQIYAT